MFEKIRRLVRLFVLGSQVRLAEKVMKESDISSSELMQMLGLVRVEWEMEDFSERQRTFLLELLILQAEFADKNTLKQNDKEIADVLKFAEKFVRNRSKYVKSAGIGGES